MMKKLLALLMCLAMVLGCVSASFAEEDIVLATVNGEPVRLSMVEEYVAYLVENYGYEIEDDYARREVYEMALEQSMAYTLLLQKAAELGYTEVTEEDMAAAREAWNEEVLYVAEAYFGYVEGGDASANNEAVVSAISMLEMYGYTEEMYLEQYAASRWSDKLYADIIVDVRATEEDAYALFLSYVEEDRALVEDSPMMYEFYTGYYGYELYYMPAGYRAVKQILLPVDENLLTEWESLMEAQVNGDESVTDEQVAAAEQAILDSVKPMTDDIYARLAAGESFESLIAEYNIDPGMTVEPYATEGYTVSAESILYDEPFVNAAFSVQNIGEVSQPYAGSYGVYIVMYLADVPSGPVEYTDEIAAEMLEHAQNKLENDAINAVVDGWLAESEIVYTEAAADYLPLPEAEPIDEAVPAPVE